MKRRDFVLDSLFVFGGASILDLKGTKKGLRPIKFGVVTDTHYAVRPPTISRFYKQSLDKLSECVDLMNQQDVDFLIELGDFKDQNIDPEESKTLQFLETIEHEFRQFDGPMYHVLGNHDMDSISKDQFLDKITNTGFSNAPNYYSFNNNDLHFIVLDANYSSEGIGYDHGNISWKDSHIPEEQLEWLEEDLRRNLKPTIVFVHQQLDSAAFDKSHAIYCPDNADKVRSILEKSGNVLSVFQGHYHPGSFNIINGINYYTLKAVIEGDGASNNSYIIVEVDEKQRIKIKGYRKAVSKYLL